MAFTKDYETTIPIPRDEATASWMAAHGVELGTQWPIDEELFVWLVAESFDRAARNFALELTEFHDEGEVPPEEIDPQMDEYIGRPAADFVWRKFTGKATRPAYIERALAEDLEHRREVAIEESNATST